MACLVGFSPQPGCMSQAGEILAPEMRPIYSRLQSLAQGVLSIVRDWLHICSQTTKHTPRTCRGWLTTIKQYLIASRNTSTSKYRQPNTRYMCTSPTRFPETYLEAYPSKNSQYHDNRSLDHFGELPIYFSLCFISYIDNNRASTCSCIIWIPPSLNTKLGRQLARLQLRQRRDSSASLSLSLCWCLIHCYFANFWPRKAKA